MAEAFSYPVENYQAFVLSLRQTDYAGDITILAPPNRTRPEALAFLRSHQVVLVNASHDSRRHNSERFWQYAALCSPSLYHYCLAADFRDVLFQANPFASYSMSSRADLVLPLEPRTFSTDAINRLTIQWCFGRAAVSELVNDTVICSGVLLGTPDGFAALPHKLVPLAHKCRMDKMSDQGALNYLIYSNMTKRPSVTGWASAHHGGARNTAAEHAKAEPTVHVHVHGLVSLEGRPLRVALEPPGHGMTYTVGAYKALPQALDFEAGHMRDGVVLNADGRPAPVVHQYDRLLASTGPPGTFRQQFGTTAAPMRFAALERALARDGGERRPLTPDRLAWVSGSNKR